MKELNFCIIVLLLYFCLAILKHGTHFSKEFSVDQILIEYVAVEVQFLLDLALVVFSFFVIIFV